MLSDTTENAIKPNPYVVQWHSNRNEGTRLYYYGAEDVTAERPSSSNATTTERPSIEPFIWEGVCVCVFVILSLLCCILAMKCMFGRYKRSLAVRTPIGYLGDHNRVVACQQTEDPLPPYERGGYSVDWESSLPQYSDVTGLPPRVCVEEDPPPHYDSIVVQKQMIVQPVIIDHDKERPPTIIGSE